MTTAAVLAAIVAWLLILSGLILVTVWLVWRAVRAWLDAVR